MGKAVPRAADGRLGSRPCGREPVALEAAVHPVALPGSREGLLLVPAAPARPLPLVVFFHGAGGDAQRSLPLISPAAQAAGTLVLLPTSAGATWDLVRGVLGADVTALDAALAGVFEHYAVDRVAFSGFSDGASYALSLGVANGDLADALLAFSPGFVAALPQHGAPRVWVSHGTQDAVLPVDRCGRRVVRLLQESGYEVQYEEFEGPHVVPPALVDSALDWWLGGGTS